MEDVGRRCDLDRVIMSIGDTRLIYARAWTIHKMPDMRYVLVRVDGFSVSV